VRAVLAGTCGDQQREASEAGNDPGVSFIHDEVEQLQWRLGDSIDGVLETPSKVRRLRSFHKFQVARRTAESKARLSSPGSPIRASCHQSPSMALWSGVRDCQPTA